MATDRIQTVLAERLGRANDPYHTIPERTTRIVTTGVHVLDAVQTAPVRIASVVEIVGVTCVGKSKLLHAILAHRLTSRPCTKNRPRVCWFDLNGALDIVLLTNMINKSAQPLTSDQAGQADQADQADQTTIHNTLSMLLVYRPESTDAMCASITSLPNFFQSEEGSQIDTLIIDALGINHYIDKFDAERASAAKQVTVEIRFIQAIQTLLSTHKVTVYVSKCALFEESKLTVSWPFPEAGVPYCPQDIMQPAWKNLVSHVVLLYPIDSDNDDARGQHPVTRRGIVSMVYKKGQHSTSRQLQVNAASVLNISDTDVLCERNKTFVV